MQSIQEVQKAVFACIDGSKFSEAVCDYALHIAKELELPLVLLHTIVHGNLTQNIDLSGNLILGDREDLLDTLSEEDAAKSKKIRLEGKELLKSFAQKLQKHGFHNFITLQRHGTLYENLKEFEDKLRIVLLDIYEVDHSTQNIIRDLNAPIIVVNKEYSPIKNIMVAFNGVGGSIRALEEVSASPIFAKDLKRYIISVKNEKQEAQDLIKQAQDLIKDPSINCEYIAKEGEALKEILESLEKNSIDILAIGSFSHGKLKTALFGSFTTKLICNVEIPLIILK